MNNLLLFLLKSTLILSVLYLAFRLLMHRETFFKLNRMVLIIMVLSSVLIPFIQSPQLIPPFHKVNMEPVFQNHTVIEESIQATSSTVDIQLPSQVSRTRTPIKWTDTSILGFVYICGVAVSILLLIYSTFSVLLLFRKARKPEQNGIYLRIIDRDIPAFSFWRYILISDHDFETSSKEIITHELSHIRMGHFYDLMLMELAKIIFWFNPLIYRMVNDLKEIHEFQADDHTLTSGIDATKYQLLIIQKSVGLQRFALANSFNHCQIKNRITMMNKQKTSKAWSWKVATFLPLLALLLMAFGREGKNEPVEQQNQERQWTEDDFGRINFKPEKGSWGLRIQLNSESQLIVGNKITDWDEAARQIRKFLDYNNTSEDMKPAFEEIIINGQERMAQKYTALWITSNISTTKKDYQDFLNSIGKVVLEIRQQYANEIYKTNYNSLSPSQKADIIRLIPAYANFTKLPVQAFEYQGNKSSLYIEIKAEGIFVLPDNNALTINELKEKAELFAKGNGGYVDVRTAAGLNEENTFEVKEALKGIEKLNIRYLKFDPIYTVVEQMAEFPGGNDGLRDWISKNTIYPNEAKTNGLEGKVYVSLVINSKGEVVLPKITRGLSPELDAEAIRLVSKMPEWKPAFQNGFPVSVSYAMPISFSMK